MMTSNTSQSQKLIKDKYYENIGLTPLKILYANKQGIVVDRAFPVYWWDDLNPSGSHDNPEHDKLVTMLDLWISTMDD